MDGYVQRSLMGMSTAKDISSATYVVSAGRPAPEHDAPVNPPVIFSSTYRGAGTVDPEHDKVYARFDNPTWNGFEEVVAGIEGASLPGLVFSSGMAAISAVMDLVPAGATILIPRHVYMSSATIAEDLQRRGVAEVIRLDIENTQEVIDALERVSQKYDLAGKTPHYSAPEALLWLESPTNPMLEVADLPTILSAAQRLGVLSAVDNTFSTGLVQQPLALGADVVVHSATKYLSGHSDVLLGIAVTSHQPLREAILRYRTLHGAIAGPMEAWLALRGIRTLSLRMERSMDNALELAQRLSKHPAVAQVRYPGLPEDAGYERARQQMNGFGAVLCIVLDADAVQTQQVAERLRLWTPATSLGGVESLVERRRRHPSEPESIPESLIRLSVGIEHVDDLYADLCEALDVLVK